MKDKKLRYVDIKKESQEKFERLDWPVWKKTGYKKYKKPIIKDQTILPTMRSIDFPYYDMEDMEDMEEKILKRYYEFKQGVPNDEKFVSLAQGYNNYAKAYILEKNQVIEEPLILNFDLTDEESLIDEHYLYASSGAQMTLIIRYNEDKDIDEEVKIQDMVRHHVGLIRIYAEENANIKVILVQSLSNNIQHIMNGITELEKNATVNILNVELGGGFCAPAFCHYLIGENSAGILDGAYIGDRTRVLDLSYNIQHYGERTQSDILVKGVMDHKSRKMFRGEINFKRGSKKAEARETEYVILLNEDVRADAVPVLLCEEDDVKGEHAASAGQADKNQMFYLMTRGLNETEAKKLIITAGLGEVLDRITVSQVRESIDFDLEERLGNA